MSTLDVKIRKIDNVEIHPNADSLDLAVIGGYRAVVKRGEFKTGDLALYIPDDTLFTDLSVAERLGIAPYLTGKGKNRVKPVRLRGSLSQGIVVPLENLKEYLYSQLILTFEFHENEDWAQVLKVEKYEEPIPIQMAGKARPWPSFLCKYDVENINRPESMKAMVPLEQVVVTEKLHGTNTSLAWNQTENQIYVCSRNTALEEDEKNLYWQVVKKTGIYEKFEKMALDYSGETLSLHGEIVGVQDLKYGHGNEKGFYAFDICEDGKFLNWFAFFGLCSMYKIPMVPIVYIGDYDYKIISEFSKGQSLLDPSHIREGVVMKTLDERYDYDAGRTQFKFLSEDYLVRKGKNVTELH